jgi:iron complex transport system substrate-binding protein
VRRAALLLSLLVAAGCAAPAPAPATGTCDPAPAPPVTFGDARNLTLRDGDGYRVLTVEHPEPGAPAASWVLLRCPTAVLPSEVAGLPRVTVPVRSVYAASTTHLPMFTGIGRADAVTGVGTAAYVSTPEIADRARTGAVKEFAPTGAVDAERVVAAHPDVLLTAGTEDPAYPAVRTAGIPVVAGAEYLEPTPLGRAEWIKLIGVLTGDEARANAAFDQVKAAYTAEVAKARGAAPVTVLAGSLYQGVWTAPGGTSLTAALVADAGGTTPWSSDASSGSLSLDLETVYAKGGQAPVWIADQNWGTRSEALAADPRYDRLAAARTGQVWAGSKIVNAAGGNDLYERGVARPDLVLGDLVAILHPDLVPGHPFTFFQRLT